MATVAGHVPSLKEPIWLQILTQIPDATGYWKGLLRYDPVVTIGKFGLASRSCQQIVQQDLIASKVRAFIQKKRQQDRSKRVRQRCRDPRIVQLSMDGNIAAVEAELLNGASLESCARWTETEEKYFYEKSWTWNNDTPLSMACSQGHVSLVQLLLSRRANPHHRVCNECDVHYTPLSIAFQLGHVECGKAVRAAIQSEENEKAKTKREAAWHIFRAATDEASLQKEKDALTGRWLNSTAKFSLHVQEGALKELVYQDSTDSAQNATLSRRCDGWWQSTLNSDCNFAPSVRVKLSQSAHRGDKVLRQVKTPAFGGTVGLFGGTARDSWGPAARFSRVASSVSDAEAAELMQQELAQREARLEARRESLRQKRARERQLERARFRAEMRAMFQDDEMDEFEESESEEEFVDDPSDDFQAEFADEDDTDEEEKENAVHGFGGHASLLYTAAQHFRKGEGGAVDLANSSNLCSMALSLEKDRPAQECSPEYSTFGKAMKLLRELAALGVTEAAEALSYFHCIDEEKSRERDRQKTEAEAKQRAMEEQRRKEQDERQKRRDECKGLRRQEIERCRPFLGRSIRTGDCTNNKLHNADFCTYRHSYVKELPPHCLHFSRGNCKNGAGCWFNHMRCICGSCNH
eukprot:TRINITY_DN92531_c0_g1_i1.p1 TRINITY_DN92531_c0_g1~~TRINITY_DN92531_c0_g1_i1.p1  ORF type:complete len:636 (-),score=107.76 TRINITY_DN92531_c0_g1_i1:59-1966(-)